MSGKVIEKMQDIHDAMEESYFASSHRLFHLTKKLSDLIENLRDSGLSDKEVLGSFQNWQSKLHKLDKMAVNLYAKYGNDMNDWVEAVDSWVGASDDIEGQRLYDNREIWIEIDGPFKPPKWLFRGLSSINQLPAPGQPAVYTSRYQNATSWSTDMKIAIGFCGGLNEELNEAPGSYAAKKTHQMGYYDDDYFDNEDEDEDEDEELASDTGSAVLAVSGQHAADYAVPVFWKPQVTSSWDVLKYFGAGQAISMLKGEKEVVLYLPHGKKLPISGVKYCETYDIGPTDTSRINKLKRKLEEQEAGGSGFQKLPRPGKDSMEPVVIEEPGEEPKEKEPTLEELFEGVRRYVKK